VADPDYPFTPKSNRYLRAGQFWAVPLSDGRFACGRVMAPTSDIGARVSFIAGLMDWVCDTPPTGPALAGRAVLDQGSAHVKTIVHTGGQVLGWRDLDADGLVAVHDRDSAWGYMFITRLAERAFRIA
jgi:hypothetical protein